MSRYRCDDETQAVGYDRDDGGADIDPITRFKSWLLLFMRITDVKLSSDLSIDGYSYLAYSALKKDEKPPYGPAHVELRELLDLFTTKEISDIFGQDVLTKYNKMRG